MSKNINILNKYNSLLTRKTKNKVMDLALI
jgi:hypothetical protein